MFKHILVTTDGSQPSQMALPYAAGLARALVCQLTLLHVIPGPDEDLGQVNLALPDPESRERALHDAGQRVLDAAAVQLDVPLQKLLLEAHHHDVAITIAGAAEEQGADVIVMAAHGLTGLSSLMGSVAERVMHRAKVPVLMVRDTTGPHSPTTLSGT